MPFCTTIRNIVLRNRCTQKIRYFLKSTSCCLYNTNVVGSETWHSCMYIYTIQIVFHHSANATFAMYIIAYLCHVPLQTTSLYDVCALFMRLLRRALACLKCPLRKHSASFRRKIFACCGIFSASFTTNFCLCVPKTIWLFARRLSDTSKKTTLLSFILINCCITRV